MLRPGRYTIGVAVLAIVLLGGGGWIAYQLGASIPFLGASSSATNEEGADGRSDQRRVVALGRLEPAGGVIEITGLAGDRVASLEIVGEGAKVKRGQPLVYLESRRLRQFELDSAEARLREARARYAAEQQLADARILAARLAVEQVEATKQDIQTQQSKLELLRANLEVATKDLKRLEGLSEKLVSDQQRERQRLVVRQAQAELRAAEALLEKMERSYELSLEAARADLRAAEASKPQVLTAIPVESLAKAVELARLQWEQTAIVAPCDGTILKVFVQPGESVAAQPLMQMANLDKMVVVATVYESDVKWIEVGQRAVVTSRAFRPPYDQQGLRGSVTHVGQLVTSPTLRSLDPFEPSDRHVVEVRIELDELGCRQTRGLSNLQVDVTIFGPTGPR